MASKITAGGYHERHHDESSLYPVVRGTYAGDCHAQLQPASPLDPVTITCLGSTETTITVRVCAGPSGAPGGFSLQWIKKSDWEAGPDGILGTFDDNSWPLSDDPRICKASFSGLAHETQWNLGPNECRDITVGTLGDLIVDCGPSCGISTSCPGGLVCDTEYVFRAFAHNEPGKNKRGRSPFSADAFCSTQPCVPPHVSSPTAAPSRRASSATIRQPRRSRGAIACPSASAIAAARGRSQLWRMC